MSTRSSDGLVRGDGDDSTLDKVAHMHRRAARLTGLDVPTVWGEFTPLARDAGAINLGQVGTLVQTYRSSGIVVRATSGCVHMQGFPDWAPPPLVLNALTAAAITTEDAFANQYCR